jgi:hypothetical protein
LDNAYHISAIGRAFLSADRLKHKKPIIDDGFSFSARRKKFFELKSGATLIDPICQSNFR